MNPFIHLKKATAVFVVGLVLACFALPQRVQATDLGSVLPGGNTADGFGVLTSLTTGGYNTGTGWFSLNTVSSGSFNTAFGAATLFQNTADGNTATGAGALLFNTTGALNTASGAFALFSNTTGTANTAIGGAALRNNTIGNSNTATGEFALSNNIAGVTNTADGSHALALNIGGSNNTAVGADALRLNTGSENTANGASALVHNTTGSDNTANGFNALINNTTGSTNVALGSQAGSNQTTGVGNVYIGVGASGVVGESDACYIRSIFGQASANGVPVLINSAWKLGTNPSSKRFKADIKPMDKASKMLYSLKPVTFRYKKGIDPQGISQFGLVAEDVEKVNPDLVVRDKEGQPYSVRYDQVNAMLLNEFLKEHRQVQELKKQVATLTAGLQKVSAQLELNRLAPQVVKNP